MAIFCVKLCFAPVCLELWSLAFEAWLLFNLQWMSSTNFKPKRRAAASRGFLVTARHSCWNSKEIRRSCLQLRPPIFLLKFSLYYIVRHLLWIQTGGRGVWFVGLSSKSVTNTGRWTWRKASLVFCKSTSDGKTVADRRGPYTVSALLSPDAATQTQTSTPPTLSWRSSWLSV